MGSAQSSYVTPETALTALVVVGAVALGYNHIPTTPKDATAPAAGAAGTASQKKGKKVKGKGKASDSEAAAPAPAAPVEGAATPAAGAAASGSLPGQFDADTAATPASGASKKSKKKGKKAASATATPGGETPALAQSVSASIDFLNASEIQLASPKPAAAADGEPAGKQKKKKGKGKAATPPAASPSTSQTLAPAQAAPAASAKDDKQKPKQTKDAKTSKAQPVSSPSALAGPTASTTSLDTDGSWTRVGAPRRGKGAVSAEASAAEQTTPSGTGTSSPVVGRSGADDASFEEDEEEDDDEEAKPGEREFLLSAAARATGETRKTLAERLVPKPRKTHVEDMLETPDYPTLARVVRVRPRPDEKPAHGFTWGDYEDVRTGDDADAEGDGGRRSAAEGEDADDDEGWGVVTGRRSKRLPSSTAATPAHKATKAPESLTKKQRQNRARQEEGKAARDAGEAERLAALERHKRQLENERIKELAAAEAKGKGKRGKESGGMVASVDEKGRLVWE